MNSYQLKTGARKFDFITIIENNGSRIKLKVVAVYSWVVNNHNEHGYFDEHEFSIVEVNKIPLAVGELTISELADQLDEMDAKQLGVYLLESAEHYMKTGEDDS